jgi:hypothetical protein
MKFTNALISIGLLTACAAQAQTGSGFDGIWVGTETVTPRSISWDPKTPKPPSHSAKVTIAVAQGGTMVGVIGGICSGRFAHVWRDGNTVKFDAHNCKLSVSLSPDGKTLIENGSAARATGYWSGSGAPSGYVNYQISGTFHRQ